MGPNEDNHVRAWGIVRASSPQERQRVLAETGLDPADPRLAVLVSERIVAHRLASNATRNKGDNRA